MITPNSSYGGAVSAIMQCRHYLGRLLIDLIDMCYLKNYWKKTVCFNL